MDGSTSDTPNLFGVFDQPAQLPARALPTAAEGPFAAVAIEKSVDRALDYAIPKTLVGSVVVGQRVRVPLGRGNKPNFGYVTAIKPTTDYRDPSKIKPLLGIDDKRVLIPPTLMELACWMSRYYIAPLGLVLECIIPSAVKKRTGVGYITFVQLAKPREEVQAFLEKAKAPKRRAVLARLLQLEPGHSVELLRLAKEAGVKPNTVRKLAGLGWISLKAEVDLPGMTADTLVVPATEVSIALNEDQQKVFDDILPRLSPPAGVDGSTQPSPSAGFSVNLLMGVTGSGKTEVYLQCIERVLAQGRQAIVLVPEIALTPQTARRFVARFGKVAILHSGLSAGTRHKYWQQIATGQAQVIVGARSAIFAPVPNLGMIVVDEEHESSYKQDQLPRYHGRDVAVKRAQLEKVPILLGSATPSLEMYERVRREATAGNAENHHGGTEARRATRNSADHSQRHDLKQIDQSRVAAGAKSSSVELPSVPPCLRGDSSSSNYHLLSLPRRVRGLSLPHVEVIDMKQEMRMRRGVNLFSQRLEYMLTNTVAQGHQAILLLNRRGYSNYVHCPSCQHVVTCKYCDKTMTYHRSTGEHTLSAKIMASAHAGQLHCHYCLAVNTLPTQCPECGKLLSLFGLGTQRVEEEMQRKFPDIKFARVDSDTMRSAKDYEELLGKFGRKEIQVMLGTQMIAKGLDYPNVTLVGVISGDTALALPDFRAAERTFQLITQVAGRAGRGDLPGRVILQTFLPDDPTIQAAIKQDYVGFAERELISRKEVGLPPFARMARIVLRDEEADKVQQTAEELAGELAIAAAGTNVQIKGPMPCAVGRIAGYFRHQIVLQSPAATPLQRVLASVRARGLLNKSERIAVDVNPVSLL
ncbi:replication restart helicase PriA [Humisphaera borealis]|uniref:Replication restart protein PriA n=1 Tax=Humisphaera borealis TaxID=2807512 RepID=A0A7M2X010_9BACT|nr:primosomal protein N' [Humisphaera borealis]QOV90782.1 primosomal protein N' [Humisphaera borealis]